MADLLDADYINSLPAPLFARLHGWWHVYDIEVQTGLFRIDACGLLEVHHIDEVLNFKDDAGVVHDPGDFYSDPERWVDRSALPLPEVTP